MVGSKLLTHMEFGLAALGLGLWVPPVLQRRALGPGDGVRLGLFGAACLSLAVGLESLRMLAILPWLWDTPPIAGVATVAAAVLLLSTLAWLLWELVQRRQRRPGEARRLRTAALLEATVFATAMGAAATVWALPW